MPLVSVEVSPGVVVQMPDYLVPPERRLQLPDVPRPGLPDRRVAGPGAGWDQLGGYDDPAPAVAPPMIGPPPAPAHAAPRGPMAVPSGLGGPPRPAPGHATMAPASAYATPDPPRAKSDDKKSEKGDVDPGTLARPSAGGKTSQDDGMDPLVRQVLQESMRGGGGRRSGGLAPSSMKEERTPGREFTPELLWRMGLGPRPDVGDELDPSADQPTWGDADPVTRKKKLGSEVIEERARSLGQKELASERSAYVDQLSTLNQEAEALDAQAQAISDRRTRIANLQKVADERATEAQGLEPRTKSEIWESKGAIAHVGAIIAMAFGGYMQGLGRSGGRNPAWDMINQSLDDEVKGEVDRYERGQLRRSKAETALNTAMTLYGDLDAAALDSRLRKISNVRSMLEGQRKVKGLDASAQERIDQLASAAAMAYAETQQKLYDQLAGSVIKQEVSYTPAPAGGGGSTLSALEKAARAKKALTTIEGADARPELKAADLKEVNQSDAAVASVDEMIKRYGDEEIPGLKDPNIFSKGARAVTDWVAGAGTAGRTFDSSEERKNKQNTENLVAGVIQSISGAGVSNEERERLTNMVKGARTKGDLVNIINIVRTKNAEFRRLASGGRAVAPTGTASSERAVE